MNIQQNNDYITSATNIINNLKTYCNKDHMQIIIKDNLWNTLYHIYEYVWDEKKFKEYFEFNLKYNDKRLIILDYISAKKCFQFLLVSFYNTY